MGGGSVEMRLGGSKSGQSGQTHCLARGRSPSQCGWGRVTRGRGLYWGTAGAWRGLVGCSSGRRGVACGRCIGSGRTARFVHS